MYALYYFFIFKDIAYIIGGVCAPSLYADITYEVITVNLNTGVTSEAKDIIHAVVDAGSASSFNRIIICGGLQRGKQGPERFCQLYTPDSNRYECSTLCATLVRVNCCYIYTHRPVSTLFFAIIFLYWGPLYHYASL